MNRIKTAYENSAPTSGELAAYREEFIKELDAPQGTVAKPLNTGNRRRWRRVAIVAACLVLCTAAVAAISNHMSIWNTSGSFSELETLGLQLPEKLGEYERTDLTYHNWVPQGSEDIKFLTKPIYRSYTLHYTKPVSITWNYSSGEKETVTSTADLALLFGSTEGFKGDDWTRFANYDPETKKWIPYTVFEYEDSTLSFENLEELSYRGATIWIFDRVRRNKIDSIKPESFSDAGAEWYDPELEMYFQVSFYSPSYFSPSGHADDNNKEWIRPYTILSKDMLLEYVKKIIDLNR